MKTITIILFLLIALIGNSQTNIKSVSGESLYSWKTQQAKVLPNGKFEWC